ncbi:MAG TPA: hypothetical protein HPP59_03830 [Deltaproteobacteria bacterium]|nr:hypothetical protein [Deltaproteobacteria bacterium]HIJ41236.1 hypothetical protein [Deltaproteobacteria bacterium]
MKKFASICVSLMLLFPVFVSADDFLGAPVIPEGKELNKTDVRLEVIIPLSHEEVVSYYREALKDFTDIKFRNWPDATYIEDDGNMPWHSITISKDEKDGTHVTIVKDNWTWIIGTLVLRYIGVFVVLMLLFAGMTVSGKIISGFVRRAELKKTAA